MTIEQFQAFARGVKRGKAIANSETAQVILRAIFNEGASYNLLMGKDDFRNTIEIRAVINLEGIPTVKESA